jgi:hypothetical protein
MMPSPVVTTEGGGGPGGCCASTVVVNIRNAAKPANAFFTNPSVLDHLIIVPDPHKKDVFVVRRSSLVARRAHSDGYALPATSDDPRTTDRISITLAV